MRQEITYIATKSVHVHVTTYTAMTVGNRWVKLAGWYKGTKILPDSDPGTQISLGIHTVWSKSDFDVRMKF